MDKTIKHSQINQLVYSTVDRRVSRLPTNSKRKKPQCHNPSRLHLASSPKG